jgi:hypothetical protein
MLVSARKHNWASTIALTGVVGLRLLEDFEIERLTSQLDADIEHLTPVVEAP